MERRSHPWFRLLSFLGTASAVIPPAMGATPLALRESALEADVAPLDCTLEEEGAARGADGPLVLVAGLRTRCAAILFGLVGIRGFGRAGLFAPILGGLGEPGGRGRPRRIPTGALENPRRKRLHETIRETPGLHASALARATEMSRVVAQHHLRVLARRGLVSERRVGRFTLYFPTHGPVEPPSRILALRDPTRRTVARALLAGGPSTQKELAVRTGLAQTVVSYHVRILEGAGLVTREEGVPRRYTASAALKVDGPASSGPARGFADGGSPEAGAG